MKRRLYILFVICASMLAMLSCKKKQPEEEAEPRKPFQPMTIRVVPSLDGFFVRGQWTSLTVYIEGGSEMREGRLVVTCEDAIKSKIATDLEISAPPGSLKRYRFNIRPERPDFTVTFHPTDGLAAPLPEEVKLRELQVLGRAEAPPESGVLVGVDKMVSVAGRFPQKWGVKTVKSTAVDFPERWYALEFVSTILMNPNSFRILNAKQREALEEWVLCGGRLVLDVSTGNSDGISGRIQEWLPGKVLGSELVDRADVRPGYTGRAELARVDVTKGSRIGWDHDRPVAVEREVGMGSVVLACISLMDEVYDDDFDEWDAETPLAVRVLRMKRDGISCSSLNNDRFLSSRGSGRLKALPAKNVLIVLIVYLLIVGPVDYLVLKKLGHLELTWITFGGVSIVFTVSLLVWVYRTKVGAFTAMSLAMIMLGPDGSGRAVYSTDIYSQKNQSYSFVAEERSPVWVASQAERESGFFDDIVERRDFGYDTDGRFAIESYHMAIWTHLMLRTDQVVSEERAPTNLQEGQSVMLGDVRYDVHDVFVLTDAGLFLSVYKRTDSVDWLHYSDHFDDNWLGRLPWEERHAVVAGLRSYWDMIRHSAGTKSVCIARMTAVSLPFTIFGESPDALQDAYMFCLENEDGAIE